MKRLVPVVTLAALAFAPSNAEAGYALAGNNVRIFFDNNGLWNDTTVAKGYQISRDGVNWVDVTYPGAPFQILGFKFVYDCNGDGVKETCTYLGDHLKVDWKVISVTNLSAGNTLKLEAVYEIGPLLATMTTSWDKDDRAVLIDLDFENKGTTAVTNFRMTWGADPDHDSKAGSYATNNDVLDLNVDGYDDWVEAEGATTKWTVGVGACTPDNQTVGSGTNSTNVDESLTDENGGTEDLTLKLRYANTLIATSGKFDTSLLVSWGTDAVKARDAYVDGFGRCGQCDRDGDGYANALCDGTDCNDLDPTIYPGAPEYCDDIDNDCDTIVDEDDAVDAIDWYFDGDGDGYGVKWDRKHQCYAPDGYADSRGGHDCDDTDTTTYPGAAELSDGVDNDCDSPSLVDEGTSWFDDDGDGYSEKGGDCDDARSDASPAGIEVCDGTDNDCNGLADDTTEGYDDDGDGYCEGFDVDGDGSLECTDGSAVGDCDDTQAGVNPAEVETLANGLDDDCDGVVDDDHWDVDRDGYTESSGDCDDEDDTVFPGAAEAEDGKDNDCDGTVDNHTASWDDDGDGYSEDEGDCDDADPGRGPAEPELADGIDQDCDGVIDNGTDVADDDGDGLAEIEGDCDDASADVNPTAEEIANGVDDDCDGYVDEGLSDGDGDGWSVDDGDCDDADGWANPGRVELCDDGVDNDCDGDVDKLDTGCQASAAPITEDPGGCNVAGGQGAGWLGALALLGLVRRRR